MPLTWQRPPVAIATDLDVWAHEVEDGIYADTLDEAVAIVADMRANHPWKNESGAAEAGLQCKVARSGDVVTITCGHTVMYGEFLENGTIYMRPYPIVAPTMDAHLPKLMAKVQRRLAGVPG